MVQGRFQGTLAGLSCATSWVRFRSRSRRKNLTVHLDRWRKTGQVGSTTPCFFKPPNDRAREDLPGGESLGIEEEENPETLFDGTPSEEGLGLWPWVNQVRFVR